jgi:flagellar hook-associated protein 3 FlgL
MPLITDQIMFANIRESLVAGQVRVSEASQKVTSGLRVAQASDDPAAAEHGLLLNASLNYLGGMKTAADRIRVNFDTLSQDLADTQTSLTRAKELTLQANNGALGAGDRADIAAEMQSLQQVVLSIANKQDEQGNYVYSGFLTRTQPFVANGTYSGDANVRRVEVAPNLSVDTNVPGSAVFNVSGGSNVLGTLDSLVTALQTNNLSGIADGLSGLDNAVNQLSVAQASVGGQESLLNGAQTTRDTAELAVRKTRQSVLEIDSVRAISDSVEAQAAYDQAIASSAQILRLLQSLSQN